MKLATKKTFRNGKVREARAGRWSNGYGAALVMVGAVTMCLNTVQEFASWGEVIDTYVWDGDCYYSSHSDRMLLVE